MEAFLMEASIVTWFTLVARNQTESGEVRSESREIE
jgi:hypothetical protein